MVIANNIDASQILKNQFDSYPQFKPIFEQLQNNKIIEHVNSASASSLKFIFVPISLKGTDEK